MAPCTSACASARPSGLRSARTKGAPGRSSPFQGRPCRRSRDCCQQPLCFDLQSGSSLRARGSREWAGLPVEMHKMMPIERVCEMGPVRGERGMTVVLDGSVDIVVRRNKTDYCHRSVPGSTSAARLGRARAEARRPGGHGQRPHPSPHVLLAPDDARRGAEGDPGPRRAPASLDDDALHAPVAERARAGDRPTQPAGSSRHNGGT
jgi:hypothetical protein